MPASGGVLVNECYAHSAFLSMDRQGVTLECHAATQLRRPLDGSHHGDSNA
jgi:hypothetical protein